MKESDVRNETGVEKGQFLPDVSPDEGKGDAGTVSKPAKRKTDDEWLAFATEDPAFFIKTSDTT
jgi:hypothetical protein